RWIDLHDKRPVANACDRHSVADEIEIELIIKRDGDRVCRNDQKECMAVGGRTRDRLGTDIGRSTRLVLDEEWLAEALGQPLTDQTCEDVGRAAGRKADDNAHRPRRIDLCPSEARDGGERGSACCQMQESTARAFSPPAGAL